MPDLEELKRKHCLDGTTSHRFCRHCWSGASPQTDHSRTRGGDYVRHIDTAPRCPLVARGFAIAFSPDGQYVVTAGEDSGDCMFGGRSTAYVGECYGTWFSRPVATLGQRRKEALGGLVPIGRRFTINRENLKGVLWESVRSVVR
jgi:hypothetical protein